MKQLIILGLIVALAVTPWIWNGVKFINCDFEADYKCEVIHGAGVVIPPASFITVWLGTDGESE